jgi:peptide/nickel transport system permease protein
MAAFILRRLTAAIVLIFLVLTLTFFMIHLAPGGPEQIFLDPEIGSERIEKIRAAYGLDRPLPEQYLRWLKATLVEGDWGYSFTRNQPVTALLANSAPATLLLSGSALLIQFAFGLLLGIAATRYSERTPDHLIRFVSVLLYALPAFWLGLMTLLLFSHTIPLFPGGHTHSLDSGQMTLLGAFADRLHHLFLPAMVLGLGTLGAVVRLLRSNLAEVMQQDYVRTARAKGASERSVLWIHGLRNAVAPLTQLFGLSLPFLVSGALVVEKVFSWPGMGRLVWTAIAERDYPVLLATTALSALFVVVGTTLADLLLAAVDPRVRDEG